jgi:hypothetical protein
LRAYRFAQEVLFDVNRFLGELKFRAQLAAQGVEGVDEPDREGRTGTHAAARRQIAIVVQLDAAVDVQMLQGLADHGMLDLLNRAAGLDLTIDEADAVLEERRQIAAG